MTALIVPQHSPMIYQDVPQSPEAEIAVLGSLIIDFDMMAKVAPLLRPTDFSTDQHIAIYASMQHLFAAGSLDIDFLAIIDQLKKDGKLEMAGGPAYLTHLAAYTPSATHAEHYARIVAEAAASRRGITVGGMITSLFYETDRPLTERKAEARRLLDSVADPTVGPGYVKVGDYLNTYINNLEQRAERGEGITGLATGYQGLDWATAGLQRGEVTVLCARPGVGKSGWAGGVADHAARAGKCVAWVSLEMSKDQIMDRLIALHTGIPTDALRRGMFDGGRRFDRQTWARIHNAAAAIDRFNLLIDDQPAQTTEVMRARLHAIGEREMVDLIIVDYLGLLQANNKDTNRVHVIGQFARDCKLVARECNAPMLLLCQLNRAAADVRPQLQHLRDSGEIEEHADNVIGLHREKGASEAVMELLKGRNSALGEWELRFDGSATHYVDA